MLVSTNTAGNATWQTPGANVVQGTIAPTGTQFIGAITNIGWSINLPAGKWMIYVSALFQTTASVTNMQTGHAGVDLCLSSVTTAVTPSGFSPFFPNNYIVTFNVPVDVPEPDCYGFFAVNVTTAGTLFSCSL